MTSTPKLRLVDAGNQLGGQLAEVGRTSFARLLSGNGPSLADRLAASAKSSETLISKTLTDACEALNHV